MAPFARTRRAPATLRLTNALYQSEEGGIDWAADAKKKAEQIVLLEQKVLRQQAEVLSMRQIIAGAVDDLKGDTLDSLMYWRLQAEKLEERLSFYQTIPRRPPISINGHPMWIGVDLIDHMIIKTPTVSPLTPPPQAMALPPVARSRRPRQKRVKGQEPERKVIGRKCKGEKNYRV